MVQDRVLVEIVTAADTSGLKEAQAGFLGMTNTMTAAIAGLGLVAVASKSAMEIAEKREKAENSLAQALKAQGANQEQADAYLNQFIDSNRAFLSDQSEVVAGYAALTRSGLSQVEVQKDLNRALDLAALKGITLADAVQLLIAAEHGRTRGLIDLGITTAKYTDAQGNVINQGKNMKLVLAEVDHASAHGRDTLTQTAQASNRLSNDWQDIANVAGPPLLSLLDDILRGADWVLNKLKELGQNQDWNKGLAQGLGVWQNLVISLVGNVEGLIRDVQWLIDHGQQVASWLGGGGSSSAGSRASGIRGYRASGGGVWPGNTYTVGENGPETLVMGGGGGGYVIPNSGGSGGGGGGSSHVHFHIGTLIGADGPGMDRLAQEILRRARYAPGT